MIQRPQSLFLALAVIFAGSLFALDYPFESLAAGAYDAFAPAFGMFCGAIAAGAALAVFQFRNRVSQRRSIAILAGLALVLIALVGGGYAVAGDLAALSRSGRLDGYASLAGPVVILILLLLARRGVTSDIETVRSMDRLR